MQEQEQEINLRECVNVIIKRKWIIITVFFVTIIVAAIINSLVPRIYEISMVLEPTRNLDLQKNIEDKIKQKAFDSRIINLVNPDPKAKNVGFEVSQPEHSDLMIISLKWEEGKTKLGVEALNASFITLSNAYKEIIDSKGDEIERQISDISDDIAAKNNEINQRKEEIEENELKLLKVKEERLNLLVECYQFYIDNLFDKIADLLGKGEKIDNNASQGYIDTIEKNMLYVDELQEKLNNLNVERAYSMSKIKDLKAVANNLKANTEELKLNAEKVFNKVALSLEKGQEIDDSAFRSYIGDIEKNMLYMDKLRVKLTGLNKERAGVLAEIKKMQKAVKPLTVKSEELTRQKDAMRNIKLIQKPRISSLPIAISKKRQNVTLAGVVGLLLGTLLAFFKEYSEKRK